MYRTKLVISVIAMATSAIAQAGVIDLTSMIGGANLYAIHDFSATSSAVEGAVIAGGNVSLESYSVNRNRAPAFEQYGVVAGGNFRLQSGSIDNGAIYVGGNTSITQAAKPTALPTNPVNFSATEQYYKDLSADIAELDATGSAAIQWSGVNLTGSGKGGVDVFNVSADLFRNTNNWNLNNLVDNQTLIFNVAGNDVSFNDGNFGFQPLSKYNVLFNFYDASNLNLKGIIGSVLAPYASVSANWGDVHGTVIVDNWNSTVAVKSDHYFRNVDVDGFGPTSGIPMTPPAPDLSGLSSGGQDLPEPGSLALMLAGVGVAGLAYRRRRA